MLCQSITCAYTLLLMVTTCMIWPVVVGYVCEQHNNPADFFLDVISMNESSVTSGKYIVYICSTLLNQKSPYYLLLQITKIKAFVILYRILYVDKHSLLL